MTRELGPSLQSRSVDRWWRGADSTFDHALNINVSPTSTCLTIDRLGTAAGGLGLIAELSALVSGILSLGRALLASIGTCLTINRLGTAAGRLDLVAGLSPLVVWMNTWLEEGPSAPWHRPHLIFSGSVLLDLIAELSALACGISGMRRVLLASCSSGIDRT